MTRRLLPDNDAWPTEASRAANNATVAFMDLLAILEEDGPVDLKDFHYILTSAAGSFVAGLSVTRRLGDPADPPNPIVRAYPRLHPITDDDDGTYECLDCGLTTTEEELASFCGGASGAEIDIEWQSTTLCSPCAENQKDRIYTEGYAAWT